MIGLITWGILIFIIACAACPGFLTALLTTFAVFAAGVLVARFITRAADKRHREKEATRRERAIDEWERKWGRKHPTRKTIINNKPS